MSGKSVRENKRVVRKQTNLQTREICMEIKNAVNEASVWKRIRIACKVLVGRW